MTGLFKRLLNKSNIKQDEINNIFIGINLSKNNFDYITVISIKNKTFSLNSIFQNFDIQTDRYNNDISFINYDGKHYYLYYTKQKLFISKNKNLVYESANGNLGKRDFYLNGDIDINTSMNFANVILHKYLPSVDFKYFFISLKEDVNYKISIIIVNNNRISAQGIYNIINGLKQSTTGFSELGNGIVLPIGYNSLIYSMLKETNIKLDNNNVEIIMSLDKNRVNSLLQGSR